METNLKSQWWSYQLSLIVDSNECRCTKFQSNECIIPFGHFISSRVQVTFECFKYVTAILIKCMRMKIRDYLQSPS